MCIRDRLRRGAQDALGQEGQFRACTRGVDHRRTALQGFLGQAADRDEAVFLGQDLFNLYVALELVTFSAVPLVCLSGRPETLAAALRYLLFALLGSILYVLGAAVESVYPVGPISDGVALNFTLISYQDRIGFSMLTDPTVVSDADELVADCLEAWDELRSAVGLRSLAPNQTISASGASVFAAGRPSAKRLPAFKQYREQDGKFYFKLVDADGRLLLQSLAAALNIRMSYFFEEETPSSVLHIKSGSRPKIESDGVIIEGMGKTLPFQELEPFLITLEPVSYTHLTLPTSDLV